MATDSSGDGKVSSAGGVLLYGIHFIFDAFGATRPLRLGVAVALSLVLDGLVDFSAKQFKVSLPSELTVANSSFGLSFCLLFIPLLFRPSLPEPIIEYIMVIDKFTKLSQASRSAKRQMYIDLYRDIRNNNGHLPQLNLPKAKEYKEKLESRS